jgi:hypothetical protein
MHIQQSQIHQSVIAKQVFEHNGVGYKRGYAGQENGSTEKSFEAQLAVIQQHRDNHRERNHKRHLHNQEQEGVLDGGKEGFVMEQPFIIANSVEMKIGSCACFEGKQQSLDHGIEIEYANHEDSRSDK